MPTITLDLSGRNGLAPRHQGDTNQTAAPNRRYLAGDGQMVSGIWNPIKKYGYMSPSNAALTQVTGITGKVVSRVYDAVHNDLYIATTNGSSASYIYRIDGLDGTTVTEVYSDTTRKITEVKIYEVAGARILVFNYTRSNEQRIGYFVLDDNSGTRMYDINPVMVGTDNVQSVGVLLDGETKRIAQQFMITETYPDISGVMLRCSGLKVEENWSFRVGLQSSSGSNPSGTWLVYKDLTSEDIAPRGNGYGETYVRFDSEYSGALNSEPWLVFETTANVSGGVFEWIRTNNDTGDSLLLNSQSRVYEDSSWAATDTTDEVLGFAVLLGENDSWYPNALIDRDLYTQHKTENSAFTTIADNGLLYVFNDNYIDVIDGKKSGGNSGFLTEQVLEFASYLYCVDAVDTNGLMYIGLNANNSTVSATDNKTFGQNTCGVYVWDRISSYVQVRDFIPIQGIREIRRMGLSKNGDVLLWCTSNSGVGELRKIQNGRAVVVAMLEEDGYPTYKDSIDYYENMIIWLGNNGIVYGYGQVEIGETERLFKLSDISTGVTGFDGGVVMTGHTASAQQTGVFLSYSSSTTDYFTKWLPNASTVTALQGDVYTAVQFLPRNSIVNEINVYNLPTTTDNGTEIARIKMYINQSATPATTYSVTNHNAKVGVKTLSCGQANVNTIQLEVEWVGNTGTDEYSPSVAIVQYTPTNTPN